MNVLFIVPYTPNAIRVRPYHLIRSLVRRGHQLTLATLWTSEEERATLGRLAAEGVRVLACRLPPWRSLWNCLRALPSRIPLQAVYCWQPALVRDVRSAILRSTLSQAEGHNSPFDVVHVEHLRGVHYGLQTLELGLPTVWDSVDCISYLFQQAARNSRSLKGRLMTSLELARTRRYEGWLVGQFDRVLVTSEADCRALQDLASRFPPRAPRPTPHALPVTVLPNGVDLDHFTPAREPREPATLVITGKMSYHANVTAVLHLIQDIMPLVWRERPDVRVTIVGKDPPRPVRDLAIRSARPVPSRAEGSAIHVTGTVPDIRPYVRRATLAVAPVPYGAGIQNKVLEAMACGTPVVASPQAISALAVRPGRDLVVAEGTGAFARAVLALLDDPTRQAQLGRAGRTYVETHHAWDAIAAQLEAIYQATIST